MCVDFNLLIIKGIDCVIYFFGIIFFFVKGGWFDSGIKLFFVRLSLDNIIILLFVVIFDFELSKVIFFVVVFCFILNKLCVLEINLCYLSKLCIKFFFSLFNLKIFVIVFYVFV